MTDALLPVTPLPNRTAVAVKGNTNSVLRTGPRRVLGDITNQTPTRQSAKQTLLNLRTPSQFNAPPSKPANTPSLISHPKSTLRPSHPKQHIKHSSNSVFRTPSRRAPTRSTLGPQHQTSMKPARVVRPRPKRIDTDPIERCPDIDWRPIQPAVPSPPELDWSVTDLLRPIPLRWSKSPPLSPTLHPPSFDMLLDPFDIFNEDDVAPLDLEMAQLTLINDDGFE
eukprot:gnl/Trimastix_PCT/4658.p1 GENE.gnl/Trimastix_PCT/4658~~gnl/Trimastix_PCT/4658.p1  ORF type:complete len:224 (+),score=31.64 gnl/Trimastix_PCT/4658:98-769(+)